MILKAKVWAEFKVYGNGVDACRPIVELKPGRCFRTNRIRVVYAISTLLKQQGKDVAQMIKESSPENETKQLTLDLTIEFRDEIGNRRRLPTETLFLLQAMVLDLPYSLRLAAGKACVLTNRCSSRLEFRLLQGAQAD